MSWFYWVPTWVNTEYIRPTASICSNSLCHVGLSPPCPRATSENKKSRITFSHNVYRNLHSNALNLCQDLPSDFRTFFRPSLYVALFIVVCSYTQLSSGFSFLGGWLSFLTTLIRSITIILSAEPLWKSVCTPRTHHTSERSLALNSVRCDVEHVYQTFRHFSPNQLI